MKVVDLARKATAPILVGLSIPVLLFLADRVFDYYVSSADAAQIHAALKRADEQILDRVKTNEAAALLRAAVRAKEEEASADRQKRIDASLSDIAGTLRILDGRQQRIVYRLVQLGAPPPSDTDQ